MRDASLVIVEQDERGVATITLNRPHRNNAYNAALIAALNNSFARLAETDNLRVVVIRGNGPHFQAGADLSWLREVGQMTPEENLQASYQTANLVRALDAFSVPTIAQIHGACIGGGTGIACACDIVIASEEARFAISEARWGAIASIIFPQLNAAIGTRNVRRYALTCEQFDARKAMQMGLVHEVVSAEQLEQTTEIIINKILSNGPTAVRASKHWIKEAGDRFSEESFHALVKVHADTRQSDEAQEGFSSFLEKRPASWIPKS